MNTIKRLSAFVFSLVLIFSLTNIAKANDIESININAEIQDDGSVIITDHRIFNADEGTEHYISLENLGNSELVEFRVLENGTELQDIGSWDVGASLEEKAGKYGINTTSDGIELCFGLGSYGRKDFTIVYKITNFVKLLTDGKETVYWQFLNKDMDPITNAKVSVSNSKGFIFKYPDTRMWGFGFQGKTQLNPNTLELYTEGDFNSSNYMVLLAIFPEGTFSANDKIDYSQDSIIEKAMEGAELDGITYEDFKKGDSADAGYSNDNNLGINNSSGSSGYSDDYSSGNSGFRSFLKAIPIGLVALGLPTLFVALFSKIFNGGRASKNSFYKPNNGDEYYRDIPHNGEFIEVQKFVSESSENWISAFILKWVNEGRLTDEVEVTGLIFSKEKLALRINITAPRDFATVEEAQLWDMVVAASGDDGVLSEKEFTKYISRKISKFNLWTSSVKAASEAYARANGLVEITKEKFLIFNFKVPKLTDEGQQLANNVNGFTNYLKDFSLVAERDVSNVKLWKDYMVWAAYMGIAKEVYEQLKIVEPRVEEYLPYNYNTILLTNNFASSLRATQLSANSSSSFGGSGGSSFGGGGGGSFGGGSGGGTR